MNTNHIVILFHKVRFRACCCCIFCLLLLLLYNKSVTCLLVKDDIFMNISKAAWCHEISSNTNVCKTSIKFIPWIVSNLHQTTNPANLLFFRENRIEQFGRFIKSMDESVRAIQDRGQVHCEKCQGCKQIYFHLNFLCHLRLLFN